METRFSPFGASTDEYLTPVLNAPQWIGRPRMNDEPGFAENLIEEFKLIDTGAHWILRPGALPQSQLCGAINQSFEAVSIDCDPVRE